MTSGGNRLESPIERIRTVRMLGLAAILLMTLAGCAGAPITDKLRPGDFGLIIKTTAAALEGGKDGESTNWTNPSTGHLGTVTPFATFDDQHRPCRNYQQTVTIEGQTAFAYDTACRGADGIWSSLNYTTLADAIRLSHVTSQLYPYYRSYPFYDYYDPFWTYPYYGYPPYWHHFHHHH